MKRTTLDDKTKKVGITLPIALLKQTDKARGDIPRSTFIRWCRDKRSMIGDGL